jgi:hypothetical protein
MATTTARRRRATAEGGGAATSSTTTSTFTAPRPSTPTPTPTSTSTSTSTATSTPAPVPTRSPSPAPVPPPAPPRPVPEREEAERAARSFVEALVRGDAGGLAALASERFSFDGDVQTGRETIRRTWRDLLVARPPPSARAPVINALEVLQAQDAAARFGKPPARLAPLVRNGVMVAVADVGGRTVVLFVAREGGRMAVLGLHD